MLYQESVLEEEFNLEGEGRFETLLSIMTIAVLKIAVAGALMRPAPARGLLPVQFDKNLWYNLRVSWDVLFSPRTYYPQSMR